MKSINLINIYLFKFLKLLKPDRYGKLNYAVLGYHWKSKLSIIYLGMIMLGSTHGSAIAANSGVKYFKSMAMDQLYSVRGIHEIELQAVTSFDCYSVAADESNRAVQVSHLVDGKIKSDSKSGIAIARFNYADQQIRIELFDELAQPVANRYGYQSIKLALDPRGKVESCLFFDKVGNPVNNEEGIFEIRCSYSGDNARVIIFLDRNTKLCPDSHGRVCLKELVDEYGRVIEQVNLDSMGKPTNNGDSICTVRFTYDDYGQVLTRIEYENDPSLVPDDYALTTWIYNDKGTVISVQYGLMKIDKETLKDPELGYLSRRSDFDQGFAIREAKALWSN